MVVARFALIRNSQVKNKGRAQKQLRGFKHVKHEQNKRNNDYLSQKWKSKNKQEKSVRDLNYLNKKQNS
jgi:hypothetical protein